MKLQGVTAIGIVVLVCGILGMIASLNMDTTVETGGESIGYGEYSTYVPLRRVHNIGLQQDQGNYMLLSGVAIISGILVIGFGALAEKTAGKTEAAIRCERPQVGNSVL